MRNVSNNSCGILNPSFYTKTSLTAAYGVLLFGACIGNVVVISLLRTSKTLARTSFNLLILNMAVADIIEVCSSTALTVSFAFVGQQWIPGLFGEISCKLVYFVFVMSIVLSISTLVIMSVDRYWAIAHFLKKPMTRPAVKRSIALSWIIAAISASPYLYKMKFRREKDGTFKCYSAWSGDLDTHLFYSKLEECVKFLVTYAIPLIGIGTINVIVGRTLWNLKLSGDSITQARIDQRNGKIYKLLVAIVSLFAFCWLFAHVNHLLSVFELARYCKLPASIPFYFFWLSHLNVAVNPIIYVVCNNRFQKGLRTIFMEGRTKNKRIQTRMRNAQHAKPEEKLALDDRGLQMDRIDGNEERELDCETNL